MSRWPGSRRHTCLRASPDRVAVRLNDLIELNDFLERKGISARVGASSMIDWGSELQAFGPCRFGQGGDSAVELCRSAIETDLLNAGFLSALSDGLADHFGGGGVAAVLN